MDAIGMHGGVISSTKSGHLISIQREKWCSREYKNAVMLRLYSTYLKIIGILGQLWKGEWVSWANNEIASSERTKKKIRGNFWNLTSICQFLD